MVSKTKLYASLDVLEGELKERLIPHLKHASEGHNDYVFCVKQFNSSREFKDKLDQETQELIEIGASVLSLRQKLNEPSDGTIAERICWYCRQWTEKTDKLNTIKLSKKFLAEING